MRPGSRGALGATGLPPGTGFARPGSSSNRLATARLRTGVSPSGPGMEAAQGYALNAAVNVSDRPVTGQGVMGMKAQNNNAGRIHDSGYYVGLLRKKTTEINKEITKLRTEVDQSSRDNTQYNQLEKKYETLARQKETLEGQLADYNLALDKTRSSTDPDDVHQMALHMADNNRKTGQELDRILVQRKQKEAETSQIEDQIEDQYRAIQKKIKDLEPGKLRAYNDLLNKQKEYHERLMHSEHKLNEINAKIRHYETDDKSNSLRKEFLNLEKNFQSLRKDADSLNEELDIANMDPKEANAKFSARVNSFKQGAKLLEDKATLLREEIRNARKALEELDANLDGSNTEEDSNEAAKYELLVKRDQDMTTFMDSFDDTRNGILQDQEAVRFVVVSALEHISKGLEDTQNMPSQEEHAEMGSAKTFKEKNLATAQKTMATLLAEKKKRERELDLLRSSEPKLVDELSNMRDSIARMKGEIEAFQDIATLRGEFENTRAGLLEAKGSYTKRKDTMRQQIQSVSSEYESMKKTLNANDIGRDIDDTEKRLKHYERTIFDLKEFVDSKTRETDYESVKLNCIRLVNTINAKNVKKSQDIFGQAKDW